jgi:hypothetical protein
VNSNFLTISSARARAGLVFLLVTAAAQAAGTLTFNADDAPGDGRGSWTLQKGSSPANPIFVAGYIQDSVPPFPIIESRGHLSFHISGLNDPIESALLRITKWGVLANGATSGRLTMGMFDVTTDGTVLNSASGIQPAIFADLGSGVSYGVFQISAVWNNSEILEIPLNRQALDAIRNDQVFSVGFAVLDGDGTKKHYAFGNTGLTPNPFYHELVVRTIPEPGAVAAAGVAGALLLAIRRRRRPDGN